jgi:CubicO group peptidase (beta-lactamase class C family)
MDSERWERFDAYVKAVMAAENIAGCAVGISRGGRPLHVAGYGMRDVAKSLPVTPDTVFGAASVTKSFSALALLKVAAQAGLNPHDRLVDHVPAFCLPGSDRGAGVEIHHVLSHTTGVPPLKRRPELKSFAEHVAYLAEGDFRLLGEPGSYLSYCNDMFLLTGLLIETAAGEPYLDFMQTKVLAEIGMPRTTVRLDDLGKMDNVTKPYTYSAATESYDEQSYPPLGCYDVGGAVRTNVLDLLRYGQVFAGDGQLDGRRIIPPGSSAQMWQAIHPTDPGWSYGYALQSTPDYAGHTVVQHGGNQIGVASSFGFVPDSGIVIAVLCNTTRAPAHTIWQAALNTSLGLPLTYGLPSAAPWAAPPEHIDRLKGTYGSAEGARVIITAERTALLAEQEGQSVRLHMTGPTEAFGAYRHRTEWIRFYLPDNGPAWAMFRGLRMLRRIED